MMMQVILLPLFCKIYQQSQSWYMTNVAAVHLDSYSKVIMNIFYLTASMDYGVIV